MYLRSLFFLIVWLGVAVGATAAPIGFCEPLAAPVGPVESVGTEAQIRDRAFNAPAGTTLLIAPGTYTLTNYVHIVNNGVALRGATGHRDDVILDFGGMVGGQFGILVDADQVVIADLSIRNAADHGVSIQGVDSPTLYNLHIVDSNDQLVKVNQDGDGSEDGSQQCAQVIGSVQPAGHFPRLDAAGAVECSQPDVFQTRDAADGKQQKHRHGLHAGERAGHPGNERYQDDEEQFRCQQMVVAPRLDFRGESPSKRRGQRQTKHEQSR